MSILNEINIVMDKRSENEAFARIAVSGFAAYLDPTISELNEIKTAVSEAVTNAIIHGYDDINGKVFMNMTVDDENIITIEVIDNGVGIENIDEARQPLFTSKPDMERSGMGFTVMETFMDSITVESKKGEGTRVVMTKKITCLGDE